MLKELSKCEDNHNCITVDNDCHTLISCMPILHHTKTLYTKKTTSHKHETALRITFVDENISPKQKFSFVNDEHRKAYRNSPTLFRAVPPRCPYDLPFPKIGGSQPQPKTAIAIISGRGKATDCKFGRHVHRVHPNKSP